MVLGAQRLFVGERVGTAGGQRDDVIDL